MINMCAKRALVCLVGLLMVGCGGGDTPVTITFTLIGLTPTSSNDLTGGDFVTITGSGFETAEVRQVNFGGTPGTDFTRVSDLELRVRAPQAPLGQAGPVTLEVISVDGQPLRKFHPIQYDYTGGQPVPQTITPTTYSATGAQEFRITGASLGPASGTTQVTFVGVGTVTATVSANAQFLTGRAPVTAGSPPAGFVDVQIAAPGGSVTVPTRVQYQALTPPFFFPFPHQTSGNASQPVKLADGFAVACSAGGDGMWGTADDDLEIFQGPPSQAIVTQTSVLFNGLAVGFLSATNSIPAIIDADTFCIASVGLDGLPSTNDDLVLFVTTARTSPFVVQQFIPMMPQVPVGALGPGRVGALGPGPDTFPGTADDELLIMDIVGIQVTANSQPNVGRPDQNTGAASFSIPYSPDGGATVFLMDVGANGTPGNADDSFVKVVVAQAPAGVTKVGAPNMVAPPVPITATRFAVPAGSNAAPGGPNDRLAVFDVSSSPPTLSFHPINTPVHAVAPRPFAAHGTGGIAVATAGPDQILRNDDDRVVFFTDIVAGSTVFQTIQGQPLLAPVGPSLVIWGPGPGFTPGDANDTAQLVNPTATASSNFLPQLPWGHLFAPLSDGARAFVIDNGLDGGPNTGDERLVVLQTLKAGDGTSATLLPLVATLVARAQGIHPFVPIGPGWGLMQSPGPDGTLGGVGAPGGTDDVLVVAFY